VVTIDQASRLEPVGIEDAYLIRTTRADDERGWLAELLRDSWVQPVRFCQVNLVHSAAAPCAARTGMKSITI
jgi:dTDP-4-dehydrorhamnose 3,5-epimerase-like enzyme